MSNFNEISSYDKAISKHKRFTIEEKAPQSKNFTVASVYPWINSTSMKHINFTNMLKNSKDFACKIYEVIYTILPRVYRFSDDIFKKGGTSQLPHCHIVKNNEKDPHKIKRLNIIFRRLYKKPLGINYKIHWWQIGVRGSMRIFGIYEGASNNTFYPLICDWYHLISPSPKYNKKDLKHLSFNPSQLLDKYKY